MSAAWNRSRSRFPAKPAIASSVPITVNVGGGTATVNMPVQAATPGIFETVMTDGTRRAVAIRPDGSFVSLQNPARRGEIIRVFVTGMGPTSSGNRYRRASFRRCRLR